MRWALGPAQRGIRHPAVGSWRPSSAFARAVALSRVARAGRVAAAQAFAVGCLQAVLAAAVGVERGRAVRAQDPQVLQAVVVADAVDVVEDQAHRPSTPQLALAADLTARRLQPLAVETVLQMVAAVRRALDHDLFERPRPTPQARALRGARIEMVGLDGPPIDPDAKGAPVAAGRAEPEAPQGLGVAQRRANGSSSLLFGVTGHEHMFALGSDETS